MPNQNPECVNWNDKTAVEPACVNWNVMPKVRIEIEDPVGLIEDIASFASKLMTEENFAEWARLRDITPEAVQRMAEMAKDSPEACWTGWRF